MCAVRCGNDVAARFCRIVRLPHAGALFFPSSLSASVPFSYLLMSCFKIDVALVAGLCFLVAFIGMVGFTYRFYSKWVQRHAVFKILDLDSDIATMTDHERSQAPPNYSRIQLLRETAAFPRPVVSLSVADDAPESQRLKPAFNALNKESDKCMW